MKIISTIQTQRQPSAPKFRSAVLVGQAILNLRRQARHEISGFRSSRLLNLASALESTLPAIGATRMSRRPSLESRPSQTARIVNLLRSRSPHWVSLPEILELRISQYSARIHQARHKWGLPIENRTKIVGGKKHSWFRLIEAGAEMPTGVGDCPPASPGSLFGELAPERYPD